MKSNELKIGNLVNIGYDCKVVRIDEYGATLNTYYGVKEFTYFHESDIRPIPLSEEILLKCGFSIATDKYRGYLSPSFRNGQRIRIKTTNSGNFIYQLNHEGYPLYLESFHQIQNLFNSLSGGQELNTSGLTKND